MATGMNTIALMILLALQVRSKPDCTAPAWADLVPQFNARVSAYVELRSEMEKGLPPFAMTENPAETTATARALADKIRAARAKARQGDIFTPAMGPAVKQALRVEMNAHTWKVIMDDNPGEFLSQVNDVYPDGKPLATMPPNILAVLPKLPVDLEYRFVERHLILLDTRARLILDRIPYAIQYADGDPTCR
jgi:hypothetical protein